MKSATVLCLMIGLLCASHLPAQNPAAPAAGAIPAPKLAEEDQAVPHPRLFATEEAFRKSVAFGWAKQPNSDGTQEITFANHTWFFTATFWQGVCHRLHIFARPPLAPNETDGMDDLNIQKLELSGDMDKFIQAVLTANQGDSTWKSDDSNPLAKAKGLWEWKRADGKAQAKYYKGSMELWGTEFAEVQRKNFQQHFLGGF